MGGVARFDVFAEDGRARDENDVRCEPPVASLGDVLPRCDAEPDTRVRRDCALAHYKFFIASELDEQQHKADEGLFVTNELWDGLAAGSVPIYWGGGRCSGGGGGSSGCHLDLLPHPDACVDARAFPSVEALAEYVLLALADPSVYARHQRWRLMEPHEWSPKFWDLVVRSAPSALCKVCDVAAEITERKLLGRDRPTGSAGLGGTHTAGGGTCSETAPDVHFVTFGSGKYVTAVDRIVDEAKQTRRFCAVHAYRGERDLPPSVASDERFSWHRAQPRGGGYWYEGGRRGSTGPVHLWQFRC